MKFVSRAPDCGYLDSMLWVPKVAVNVDGVKNALTFILTDKRGNSRYLCLYDETEDHLVVPREFWDYSKLPVEVVDCRPIEWEEVQFDSHIVLDLKNPQKTVQRDAVEAIMQSTGGILQLACGRGKTVVALEVVARKRRPALVVVDNTNLMTQWKEEIKKHLGLKDEEIGLIQADRCDWKKKVVLSTYQTLASRAGTLAEEIRRWFGLVIWDEAHHIAAPIFCRSAALFYGMRLGLTATAERTDGAHVVYNFHLGKVLFKDLRQDLIPKYHFLWTGLTLDMDDPKVMSKVVDKNGELHTSRLASFFASWKDRLHFITSTVKELEKQGRKVLVLSTSVNELVNLLAVYNGTKNLYTDIPVPTPGYFQSKLEPKPLNRHARARTELDLKRNEAAVHDPCVNPILKKQLKTKVIPLQRQRLAEHLIHDKITKEHNKRKRAYIKKLLAMDSTAGLMVGSIPTDKRMHMLREKQVLFSIYRYGLEGLDKDVLDTVLTCEPLTSKNAIQQFVGRIQRRRPGKKEPWVFFVEDDIGIIGGMCHSVRRVLREWSPDEGGPFKYEMIGHPKKDKWKKPKLRSGQSSPPATANIT